MMMAADAETNKWRIARAIWEEDTNYVAYVLEGVKTADAITQRMLNAAPAMYKALGIACKELHNQSYGNSDCHKTICDKCPIYKAQRKALYGIEENAE